MDYFVYFYCYIIQDKPIIRHSFVKLIDNDKLKWIDAWSQHASMDQIFEHEDWLNNQWDHK